MSNSKNKVSKSLEQHGNQSDKTDKTLAIKYKHIIGDSTKRLTTSEIVDDIVHYYEEIIKVMPGNVFWLDANGCGIGCSQNVLDMFGFKSIDEYRGLTFEEVGAIGKWDPAATASFKRDTFEVIRTGKAKLNVEEPPIPHADGRMLYFLSSRVPLFDHDGKVIGVVGISIDITDRKLAEQFRIERDASLRVAKNLELLAGNIAHELRTPLAIININAENLQFPMKALANDLNYSVQLQEMQSIIANIKKAVKSGKHAIDMILAKLRAVANQTSNKPLTSFTNHSIAACITEALAEYPFAANERDLVGWKNDEDFTYFGDQILTKHILYNLLKNSLYFIQHAGKGEITISLRQGDLFNYLIFRDTAQGISEDILPTIFNQFTTNRRDATGLGLAFCKMLMQTYKGDIVCHSEENSFAEFVLSFPKVQSLESHQEQLKSA